MTIQHDPVDELLGLAGTFPRPGWVVLDAARDHRFTGEVGFDTTPAARVYFDRGGIYFAERATDASIGARLVDAGALTAVDLEHGLVRVGGVEHLGRLFDRVPTVDRHAVAVTVELMTDDCVSWLASQRVSDVEYAPYRHHPSGVHQWDRALSIGVAPSSIGGPLPAPRPSAAPVSLPPPDDAVVDGVVPEILPEIVPEIATGAVAEPVVAAGMPLPPRAEPLLDGVIEWDEPAWFDVAALESRIVDQPPDTAADSPSTPSSREPAPAEPVASVPDAGRVESPAESPVESPADEGDWIDRLERHGLPDADPLASTTPLPRLPVEPIERFELVWPSGEIDEEFGAVDSVADDGHDPDADRIGATTRVTRPEPLPGLPTRVVPSRPVQDVPATGVTADVTDGVAAVGAAVGADAGPADAADEVVLAVRRAVASIEVGAIAARQRLVGVNGDLGSGSRGTVDADGHDAVPAPGRVAVRSGRNDWSRRTDTRSVFDAPVIAEPAPVPEPQLPPIVPTATDDHATRRAGALRRLISSLRR